MVRTIRSVGQRTVKHNQSFDTDTSKITSNEKSIQIQTFDLA